MTRPVRYPAVAAIAAALILTAWSRAADAETACGEVIHTDYSRWPNIERWIARMKDRPTCSKVNVAFYTYFVQPYAQAKFETL